MAKYKMLLVNDEPDIIDFLSYNLKKHGYDIYTARDGQEGFECAHSHLPDLIVSDILMPRCSGVKMCTRIKEHQDLRHIPVIFLSATSDDMGALSAMDAGGDHFLSKPIRMQVLLDTVHRILQRPEQPFMS